MSELISKLATYLSPATLQFDLATAAIALIALIFSSVTFYQQRRISIETLRIQRRLLLEKQAFMSDARAEVQPQRRRDFLN